MTAIDIIPERARVSLRPRGELAGELLRRLEDEARDLVDRGFDWIGVDLSAVSDVGPEAAAALAAVHRHACAHGARLTVTLGDGAAGRTLAAVGLLGEIAVDPDPEALFFEWSR